MRRQLPAITQRLSATLDKLQRPGDEEAQQVPLREWWEALKRQYQAQDVEFSAAGLEPDMRVPKALFDSVADNLLQNAIAKRAVRLGRADPRVAPVRATGRNCACTTAAAPCLPISQGSLAARAGRVARGLGIGLYQAARHAEKSGYALALVENRDGAVCFALAPARRLT